MTRSRQTRQPASQITNTGAKLEELFAAAYESVVIVAPFIKKAALARLLTHLEPGITLNVITRWRIAELADGISDLEVFELVTAYGGTLRLRDDLHAKIYASESSVLTGSANVTAAGLNWNNNPNLEVLVRPSPDHETMLRNFCDELAQLQPVDQGTVAMFQQILDAMPPRLASASARHWIPHTEEPLWLVEAVLSGKADAYVDKDRIALGLHDQVDESEVRKAMCRALAQSEVITDLRRFLLTERRFGEVSQWLKRRVDETEPKRRWSATMNWLLELEPAEWRYRRPRHSELLTYVPEGAPSPAD